MENGQAGESGFVALYAARVQGRSELEASPRPSRSAPGVRAFGRPVPTRRARGRRAAAVSAMVATGLIVGTQAVAAAPATHQVQPGETLSSIASQYSVTVQQLAQLNQLPNPDLILAGSTLTIQPDSSSHDASVQDAGAHHQVTPRETLTGIAEKYGVTVEAIAQLNGIANPDIIEVGTDLSIPTVGANATQPATLPPGAGNVSLHLVVPGETLYLIAQHYGVSLGALAGANDITDVNHLEAGQMLRIPAGAQSRPIVTSDGATKLPGMPVVRQSLPLSCEAAAVSITTAYWGNQVSEWVFIENMPTNANPHLGFRGSITGAFGGTKDYGVYAEPFVSLLSRYGFTGDVFYAEGDAAQLKSQIDLGHPVVTWITNMATKQTKSYGYADGARFALVPQEHAVVVYGYDENGVYVADPGDGAYRQIDWKDFLRSWGYFDGMSLAVYPSS